MQEAQQELKHYLIAEGLSGISCFLQSLLAIITVGVLSFLHLLLCGPPVSKNKAMLLWLFIVSVCLYEEQKIHQ